MNFNSIEFAVFLPVVFVIYWSIPHKFRWILLLISSYYFYMSWNPKYVILIFTTTLVSYIAGRLLENQKVKSVRKWILACTLVICLGVLFFFKYFNFVSESAAYLLHFFTINLNPVTLELLLPVGISFYTFQTLSYVIDVYRGEVKAERHFGLYATFISFFPQLVAGPIERTKNLLPQMKREKRFDYSQAAYGIRLMLWGFFKKLAIADAVAVYVDSAYLSLDMCTGFDLLFAVFFFTIQIYCDFSGYSDIAVGTAKLLGINLVTNFRSPYFSTSVKEFWDRWHISLSTWFRDYVYIPLGGNRCSKARNRFNLILTFLASGLWHGANWKFVVWGGVHGVAQVIEKSIPAKNSKSKWNWFFRWMIVFAFCNVAWILFRADNITDTWYVIKNICLGFVHPSTFMHTTLGLSKRKLVNIMISVCFLAVVDYASIKTDVIAWLGERKGIIRWMIYFAMVFYIILSMPLTESSFIYFQF